MIEGFDHLISSARFKSLCELGSGGTALLKELTGHFINLLETESAAVKEESVQCRDGLRTPEKLRASLHSLKGAALNLGFDPIVAVVDAVQYKVKNQNIFEISEELRLLEELKKELIRFKEKL